MVAVGVGVVMMITRSTKSISNHTQHHLSVVSPITRRRPIMGTDSQHMRRRLTAVELAPHFGNRFRSGGGEGGGKNTAQEYAAAWEHEQVGWRH